MDKQICQICENELIFSWTDTHGVAQCYECGSPYTIYHYEDNKRIEAPPRLEIKEEYIQPIKKYIAETGYRIPGGHSFPGGQELATKDEIEAFAHWMNNHCND